MTYQVLARKWRPKDFASLVGQDHVVRALTHALDQQRLHHAYLFTGTRGVGKTTLSRILAKALNCETGITSVPCGVCRACREIDAGRFVDYVEMDAASNRGVDEMAALLERAIYAPVDARFKVYMIDEVHMLTNHAFNAMLKTLEEPPAHVKFILATTDPQKIPVTVLSRCLQFNLKQMPAADIVAHLDHVLQAEGIASEPQALRLLSRAADGSMRDALSLTDQAIAYAAGMVSEEAVRGMLGALDQHYLIRLLDGVMAGDGVGVLAVADEMASRSLSFSIALQDLAQLLNRIGWAQYAPASVLEEWPEAQEIKRLSQLLHAEQIQLFYQIATMGRSELGLAPDEYAGFTMTLLRMLAFRPVTSGGTMLRDASGTGSAVSSVGGATDGSVGGSAAGARGAGISATRAPSPAPATSTSAAASSKPVAQSAPALRTAPVPRPVSARESTPVPEYARVAVPSVPVGSGHEPASDHGVATNVDVDVADVEPLAAPAPMPPAVFTREPVYTREPVAPTGSVPSAAPVAPVTPAAPVLPASAPAPAPAVGVARNSPARAALEALGALGGSNRAASRAPLARTSTPVPARAPAPSMSQMTAPVSRSTALAEPAKAGAASSRAADRASDGAGFNAPDDEAPPWAAAPWDDDGAAAFLDSAQQDLPRAASLRTSTSQPASQPASQPMPHAASQPTPQAAMPSAAPANKVDEEVPAGMHLSALGCDDDWPTFAATLDVKGLAQQVALQSELIEISGTQLRLRIPVAQLASGAHVDKVVAAIADRLGRAVELHIEVGSVRATAAAVDAARKAQAQRQAEAAIQNDPFVQALLRDFDASIMPGSTQAIAGSVVSQMPQARH